MAYIPTVIENEGGNRERAFDIYSRLLRDRIIIIGRPIDDTMANLIVAQLIFLSADDPEKEIQIYINSPGRLGLRRLRDLRHHAVRPGADLDGRDGHGGQLRRP